MARFSFRFDIATCIVPLGNARLSFLCYDKGNMSLMTLQQKKVSPEIPSQTRAAEGLSGDFKKTHLRSGFPLIADEIVGLQRYSLLHNL